VRPTSAGSALSNLGNIATLEGDLTAARDALSQAVRADETAFGPSATQTLSEVAELAAISEPASAAQLEPLPRDLWRRDDRERHYVSRTFGCA